MTAAIAIYGLHIAEGEDMAKSLTRQTFGEPSHRVLELNETSDQVARLSEAGYAYKTKLRELEHQFEVNASELREGYIAEVLEIHTLEAAE
jgi:hypothetical protein